jgi:hypothetical protein
MLSATRTAHFSSSQVHNMHHQVSYKEFGSIAGQLADYYNCCSVCCCSCACMANIVKLASNITTYATRVTTETVPTKLTSEQSLTPLSLVSLSKCLLCQNKRPDAEQNASPNPKPKSSPYHSMLCSVPVFTPALHLDT